MTIDTPTIIHKGEIWQKSQCRSQEEHIVDRIYLVLQQNHFQKTTDISHTRSVWQRQNLKVVVSLVDDFWDCASNRAQETPYLFDQQTLVITDNFVSCPTLYRLYQMPASFYGIYYHQPDNNSWSPDRDYSFAVNRLDYKRMQILAEVYQHLRFGVGYVNFNCDIGGFYVANTQARQQAFLDQVRIYAGSPNEEKTLSTLAHMMPLKNYDIEHDNIFTRSWLNLVVETYSSDNVISFSEKIFRCLVTPAPWAVYAGRYSVARLRQLGFDVLDDVVDHSYDGLMEMQHKISNFTLQARNTITKLKTQDWHSVRSRCESAAQHNQKLLKEFFQEWTQQQPSWLDQLSRDFA
jgi:hypothetical protein